MVLQQSQKHLTALGVELTFQLGVVQVGGRLTGTTPSPWPTAGPSPPVSSRGPAATSWPTDSTSPEPAGDSPVPKPSSSYEHSAATATSRHTGPGTSTENDTASTNPATSTAPFPEPPEVPPEEPHPNHMDQRPPPPRATSAGQGRVSCSAPRCLGSTYVQKPCRGRGAHLCAHPG